MDKTLKIIRIIILIILLTNFIFYVCAFMGINPIYNLWKRGVIIKAKPYAFLFVHGNYCYDCGLITYQNETQIIDWYWGYVHLTSYDGINIPTESIIHSLKRDGYTKIWGTWCHTGKEPYISKYLKQERVYNIYNNNSKLISKGEFKFHYAKWDENVSRRKKDGIVYPIWVGLGFIRI